MNLLFGILLSLSFQFPSDSTTFDGIASYYHNMFHGRFTANGERFDQTRLTAAHKTLEFGTIVRVRNLKNNRWVVVRINDRLPPNSKRMIDLSRAAARELGMILDGIVPARMTILQEKVWVPYLDYLKPKGMLIQFYSPKPRHSKYFISY
ncbi:septal ring lytic transglycosylase RlpA family protein [Peijinzhouia sedimentorum]